MLTDLDKEIVDKIEEAIRMGFQIAKDYADINYTDGDTIRDGEVEYIEFLDAERALERKITEMRNAVLGQETA